VSARFPYTTLFRSWVGRLVASGRWSGGRGRSSSPSLLPALALLVSVSGVYALVSHLSLTQRGGPGESRRSRSRSLWALTRPESSALCGSARVAPPRCPRAPRLRRGIGPTVGGSAGRG